MPCDHPNLVPYELRAGKVSYKETTNVNTPIIDLESNIIGAHLLRVVKYYCPKCEEIITIPKKGEKT